MRFFDRDDVGCYLDHIGVRTETVEGKEIKYVDLTLRVQPFTVELSAAVDPDVRAALFNLGDATPKKKLKTVAFNLTVPRQSLAIRLTPEQTIGGLFIPDVEITDPRARTEKGVDGFGFVFYASFGPVGRDELEYLVAWHTHQRFITFAPQDPVFDFGGAAEDTTTQPAAAH